MIVLNLFFIKFEIMFFKNIILAFSFCLFSNISEAQALLKFDKDTVDFGILKEGDTVYYDFWFTNTGNLDLEIKQAWPSCGCTHPTFTKGIIKPGERGMLKVEFLSAGFGSQSVHKNIVIINNGPEKYANFIASILPKDEAAVPKADDHKQDHDHSHPHVEEVKPKVAEVKTTKTETKVSSKKKKRKK